jgi:hypothetical protein
MLGLENRTSARPTSNNFRHWQFGSRTTVALALALQGAVWERVAPLALEWAPASELLAQIRCS